VRVSFLIAAHDEVETIRDVLDRIRALGIDAQIVAVDDGSTDGTAEAVERRREEEGEVVPRTSSSARAPRRPAPARVPLLAPGREPRPLAADEPPTTRRSRHGDGVHGVPTDLLRSLRLTQDDFAIEPELTGEVCRRGLRIYQLPIAYYGRTYAEGKKITWRDGVKAALVLVQVRPRR
jgi:Glycosyl transferase family 2